ncbi:MAG: hypothetical protein R2693_07705 [Nocardioidaceae bacterium]
MASERQQESRRHVLRNDEPGMVKKIFTDRLYQSMIAVLVIFVITVAYLFAVILRAP